MTRARNNERIGSRRNIVRFLAMLLHGAHSLREMTEKTGMHYETLRPVVNMLRAEGILHVSHWRTDSMGRQSIAVYQFGFGVDAPKRKPKTGAQRSLAYTHRKGAADEAKLFKPVGRPLVRDTELDRVLRGAA